MKKITTPQLLDALVEQRETGHRLGEILIARCFVTREDIEAALRSQGVNRLTDTGDAPRRAPPTGSRARPTASSTTCWCSAPGSAPRT